MNFVNEFYTTPLGTFALTQGLLNNKLSDERSVEKFRTLYWALKKKSYITKAKTIDKKLLQRISKDLGCQYKTEGVTMVSSPFNVLFTFYTDADEEGNPIPLPIREDGVMSRTLVEGVPMKLEDLE